MDFDFKTARAEGYDDTEIADFLSQEKDDPFNIAAARNEGYEDKEIVSFLEKSKPQPKEGSGIFRRAVVDPTVSALKGTLVGIPEIGIGLADFPTLGLAGKAIDWIGEKTGLGTLKEAGEAFDKLLSPETQEAKRKLSEAKGFSETVVTGLQNPSSVVNWVVENISPMKATAKGVGWAIPKVFPLMRAAIAEGLVTEGQNIEQTRQMTDSGLITPTQALAITVSSALTGVIGFMGGKLAARLGTDDFDVILAAGRTGVLGDPQKNVFKKILYGAVQEGVFEELPQSMQEQIAQNFALGKPITDNVLEQGAIGMLLGMAQSTGVNVASHLMQKVKPILTPVEEAVARDPLNQEIKQFIQTMDKDGNIVNIPMGEGTPLRPGAAPAAAEAPLGAPAAAGAMPAGYASEAEAIVSVKARGQKLSDFNIVEREGRFFPEKKATATEILEKKMAELKDTKGKVEALAKKISTFPNEEDYTPEELQLAQNYPDQLEAELKRLATEEKGIPPSQGQGVQEETTPGTSLTPSPEENVAPGANMEAEYKKQAEEAGITFNGMQERVNKPSVPLFTDPETKATFSLDEGETLQEALDRKRKEFAPKVEELAPKMETHRTSLSLFSEHLKAGNISPERHQIVADIIKTLDEYGLDVPIEFDNMATKTSEGAPLKIDANTAEGEQILKNHGASPAQIEMVKKGKAHATIRAQVIREYEDKYTDDNRLVGSRLKGQKIILFNEFDAESAQEELIHVLQATGHLKPGEKPGNLTDEQWEEKHAEEISAKVKAGKTLKDLVAEQKKNASIPAEGEVRFSIKTKEGKDINKPGAVLAKIKNDNPLETWSMIEKIAKKFGQLREVEASVKDIIMSALKKAPTVSELAATAWAGRAARWWYTDDGNFFKKVLGKDAYKFLGVMAATSPQAKAETMNVIYGVRAWADYVNLRKKLGREPNHDEIVKLVAKMDIGMASRRGGVIRALSGEQLGATEDTLKTRFYHNALWGVEMGAVLDIWHGRQTGQLKFVIAKESLKYVQDLSDSMIYSVLANRMGQAAKVLNVPQSASQAAQWCVIKAIWDRMGDPKRKRKNTGLEALKSLTNKDIALAGNYTTGIANFNRQDHPIIKTLHEIGISQEEIDKLRPAWEMLEERGINPNEQVYRTSPEPIRKELERLAARLEKTRDVYDMLRAQDAYGERNEGFLHVSLETVHGPLSKLSYDKKWEMHNEIRKKVLTDAVIKALGASFGVKVIKVVDGPGTWFNEKTNQVEENPNFTLILSIPPGKVKKALASNIRAFAATLAHANRQKAVGFTHPVAMEPLFEAQGGPVVSVSVKKMSREVAANLTQLIIDTFPENTAFLVPSEQGFMITMPYYDNKYPLSYDQFVELAHKVIDTAEIPDINEVRYFEKDTFDEGDLYEGGRTGEENAGEVSEFENKIRDVGGPRGLKRSNSLLSRIDKIKESRARGKIREQLERERTGQPPGKNLEGGNLKKGQDTRLSIKLSKQDKLRVQNILHKDPSAGAIPEFKNKSAVLTHWSNEPNLSKTDPSKYGTGYAGAEKKRKLAFPELWLDRSYTAWGKYIMERGLGRHRYQIIVPGNKIYDDWEDPLNLWPSVEEIRKAGYFTMNAQQSIHEMRIKDAGFWGYGNTNFNVVALFEPVEVKLVDAGAKTLPQQEVRLSIKLPDIVKRQIGTWQSTWFDNPQNFPKEQMEVAKEYLADQKDLKWWDTIFSVPFRMALKYAEWKEAWRIHGVSRPEKRAELAAEHVRYAEAFLTLRDKLRKKGLSKKDIDESVSRVERTIIASDIILHDRLVDLKEQAKTASKEGKIAIQQKINELERLRRFSDEELRDGFVDEYGNTIKLNDTEIEAYASVRNTFDNMMSTIIDWLSSQVYRGYKNKRWYTLLTKAAGMDLTKEAVQILVGKKGLNAAAIAYSKKLQVDIEEVFNRLEQKLTEIPEAEIKAAGEEYKSIAEKVSTELLKVQSHLQKMLGIKDTKEATKLTKEVFAAYMSTRPQLLQIRRLRNQMNDWIGFFPRYRDEGEHKIRLVENIYDDEGNITEQRHIYTEMFTNLSDYAAAYERIMDKYAKDGKLPENYSIEREPVSVSPEMAFEGVNDMNMQKVFDDAIDNLKIRESYYDENGNKVDVRERIREAGFQAIADQFKKRGAMKSSIHRSQKYGVIKGYNETDLHQILLAYISAMSGVMTKQAAAADFMDLLRGVKNRSMFSGLARYNREMLRNDSKGDQVSGMIRSFAFIWYLGGLIKSAVVNTTQNPIVGFAELSKYMREHKLKGVGDIAYAKAMKDVLSGNLSEEEKRLVSEMVTKGIAQDLYIQSIFEGLQPQHAQHVLALMRWLGKPFSMTEVYNRKSAAVALYRQAFPMYKKQGMSDAEAYEKTFEDARTFIDNVHYAYGKANRPLWMQSGDIPGTALKTFYTFRGYTHNFLLRQAELLSQKDFRTVLHTLAYIALLGGLAGLPFFRDLFDWIEKQFGYSASKEIKSALNGIGGKALENFGMHGLPGLAGANISGSLAMGLPWPIGSETPEDSIFGVYGGLLQKGIRAKESFMHGDTRRALAELSPEFVRHPLVAMRESEIGKELTGSPGYATTTKGRPIYGEEGKPLKMQGSEVFIKTLGFNPTDYSRQKDMIQTIKRQELWAQEAKADISETYRIAKINKDKNATKDMMRSVRELNQEIRSRGIQGLVAPASVSRIIQSARQVKTLKDRREMMYKRRAF